MYIPVRLRVHTQHEHRCLVQPLFGPTTLAGYGRRRGLARACQLVYHPCFQAPQTLKQIPAHQITQPSFACKFPDTFLFGPEPGLGIFRFLPLNVASSPAFSLVDSSLNICARAVEGVSFAPSVLARLALPPRALVRRNLSADPLLLLLCWALGCFFTARA